MKTPVNNSLQQLRKKAEGLVSADKKSISTMLSKEIEPLIHELQLYHVELEMQNDELQHTTIELDLQRAKFANLFELAPVGYIVTNKAAVIQDANRAALQLLGFDKSFLQYKPFLLHIFKDDLDMFYIYFQKLLLSPKSLSCKLRMITANKQIISVKLEGITMNPGKEDLLCYLTLTDITEKQLAEQKLQEAKTRLEIGLSASLTGIWEIDIITGKVFLDKFCCSLFGLDFDCFDAKYDTLLNQIHPNDRKNVELHIRHTIIAEKPFNIRFRTVSADQNIKYIQGRAQVIRDKADKKRFIGTFTDISEKMIMELETIRVKEENQQMILAAGLQAEENEKKRISEVLHNGIAQMLYAIKLNIDQVKKASDVATFEQITTLLNQSIKDIRNISFELAPSILTDFGLAATLEDMAARLCGKQLFIQSKVFNFDQNQNFQLQLNIFRMIQELVNNAIRHASPTNIRIEVIKKHKTISVAVADNGTGFKNYEDAAVPKGIGLSSIRNRLRLYKGNMRIEPQPAGGTIVNISLKS
ncbi:MAG: PAS domain S-box protein [Sphingobacteriaceae bacterium]|nr:MAG: PAS domain S-box protein [Sphingobacteriaceae bacterium]